MMEKRVEVSIDADTTGVAKALSELQGLADRFGQRMTAAFAGAVVEGKSFEDVLRSLAMSMARTSLQKGLQPLQGLVGNLFAQIAGGAGGSVKAFANGGVVNGATLFPMGGGAGLMGEAGPEAIMPLRRGSDGKLGVAGGEGGRAVNITFNVQASDAASFRKSEAQVTAMLSRAVRKGARHA
ncbi:phage tail tape measure protein [Notoacmeibacter sp. MSK16QG-6]|uniref:phage tail tape measure protein n=1 Tax=Notoacmeibacter sp. MSK16QG-6 TaxID=2957982 RepID=UPI0020A093CE|nr:phage tail tape measure protein [Notoacmeibacter sp. MSK16QG-6]MCP1198128.1 phage tail tape measure protein [Notoacmeibacter sp. MSK16QG-6]